jgi:hypothetical protein
MAIRIMCVCEAAPMAIGPKADGVVVSAKEITHSLLTCEKVGKAPKFTEAIYRILIIPHSASLQAVLST